MNAGSLGETRAKILQRLKIRGPQTASGLASHLHISTMGVHQHLRNLEHDGLVRWHDQRGKVGRPSRHWELTEKSRRHFPDDHRELAVSLLSALRELHGSEGLRELLVAWRRREVAAARPRIPLAGCASPRERVEALTAMRNENGYMAEMREDEDGSLRLLQYHCPVSGAAEACPDLCHAEMEAFQELLGDDLRLERLEHIPHGDRCCAYRIAAEPRSV